MSISVVTKRDEIGNVERFEIYDTATSLGVDDGHLVVTDADQEDDGRVVAIYAPSAWLWASVI